MKPTTKNNKPDKLDRLLTKELNKVKRTVNRLPNGRTKLARYLGIRLSEVSRYLSRGARKPNGAILSGMRAFVAKHEPPMFVKPKTKAEQMISNIYVARPRKCTLRELQG